MDRNTGLDARSSSCTVAVIGPIGRRLQSQFLERGVRREVRDPPWASTIRRYRGPVIERPVAVRPGASSCRTMPGKTPSFRRHRMAGSTSS
jgi:hypothetical protein